MNALNSILSQKYLVGKSPEATSNAIKEVFDKKGYNYFTESDLNLNIFGIRNSNGTPDSFDDVVAMTYKINSEWQVLTFDATVDAGLYYLKNLANEHGTAILVPGQYPGSHEIGMHHDYAALTQKGPVKVYRDKNLDGKHDMDSSTIETGYFGINIHHAWALGLATTVSNWSAGCSVIRDIKDFEILMSVARLSRDAWGNSFTYTLLESKDFIS